MDNWILYESIGALDEELLARSEYRLIGRRKRRLSRRFVKTLIAVAVAAGLLLTAEAGGTISNLFAPLFGYAQSDLIDSVGRPIGVSVSADGYTLTADAVVGDSHRVVIVYTLRRDDEQPIEGALRFDGWDFHREAGVLWLFDAMLNGGGSGGLGAPEPVEGDPSSIRFYEEVEWRGLSLFPRYHSVQFYDLVRLPDEEGGEETLIAEGPWKLDFTLRHRSETRKIRTPQTTVTSALGYQFRFNKVEVSSFGVYIRGKLLNPPEPDMDDDELTQEKTNELALEKIAISVRRKDGTVSELPNGGLGLSGSDDGKPWAFRLSREFEAPVPLDEIQAVIVGGEEIPIE